MVDAMLEVLTEQVFTALQEHARFALDFQGQFEKMKTKLDLTKALLADTENMKVKKESVKNILISLRDLIYEADNILTDCLVRVEYQKDGYSCTRFALQKPLFLYQTGKKLKYINAELEAKERSLSRHLTAQSQSSHGDTTNQHMTYTSQDCVSSEIIGLEEDLKKLKGWISSTNDVLLRIGITGMGGLGKTTVAQKLFNDIELANRYEKMIWVSVTQASSQMTITKSMLEQLESQCSISDASGMLHKLNQLLGDKACLIVMDDVWEINPVWWEQFCSGLKKESGKSSCIIITTRNEDVAVKMAVDKHRIHQPKPLNDDESWLLFINCVFSGCKDRRFPNDEQFQRVGKEILEKCGGLPLAIKAIAALLAQKRESLILWKEISSKFHESTIGSDHFETVMASLRLSYDELPIHLKQCILCFSIYPEDFNVQAEQLIHWWIAEGLVQGKGTKTAKELGFEYLSELVSRCLVDVVRRRGYDGRVYCCRMHDMVRELTIRIVENESFGNFDEQSRQVLTPNSRWLGFTSEMDPKSLRENLKLRALLLMPGDEVVLDKHIRLVSSLRMLDFSLCKLKRTSVEELMGWICSLKRLAYLNLSGISGLKELPSSIRKLRNLQVLILGGCSDLEKLLPPSITSLRKLVVLDLGSCQIQYQPRGLERLSYLQELSGFKVGANRQSYRLIHLQKLIHLRVLRLIISNESVIDENEGKVLLELKKLKVLAIDAQDCKDDNISMLLDSFSPPPSLQELYLRRYLHEILPSWINPGRLCNLQYLCIENGDVMSFQASPQWVDETLFTWNIEGLCFKVLQNLKLDWNNLVEDLPLLRYAEVSGCQNLQNFPNPVEKIWRKSEE